MAKRISFTPQKTPSGTWRLNVPAKLTESGKRERHFFRTRDLALTAAAKLKTQAKEFGEMSQAIPPSLAEMATATAKLLEPWGASLLDAVNHYVAHRERESASRPLNAAADAWLASCDDLRGKTLCGYRQTAAKLKEAFGGTMLATITTEALQAALTPRGTPPTAAAGHIRRGKVFWNWSVKRGWCEAQVAERLETPKASGNTEIEILTVEDARALLRAAQDHFPQAVASYALQLFGGIRAEEITRIEENDVTPEGIELTAAATKKGRRRHITPSATLKAWLTAYPFTPCSNWKRIDVCCRRMAGWQLESATLLDMVRLGRIKEIPTVTRGAWPQNALRHSHASYSVAAGVSLETLLFEFGHSGTPAMLRQHYVGTASKKDALQYFQILPEGVAIPVLAIA